MEEFWKMARWEKRKHIRGKVMLLFGQAQLRVSKKGSTYTNSRSVTRGGRTFYFIEEVSVSRCDSVARSTLSLMYCAAEV